MKCVRDVIWRKLGFLALLLTSKASAYVDSPIFSPASPTSTQTVVMKFRTGYCHSFADESYQLPEILIQDGFIDITVFGLSESGVHCNFPAVIENSYTIGPFPTGSYNVRLFRRAFGPPGYTNVDSLPYFVAPLAVSQTPPRSVPASDLRIHLLLVLAITGIAFFSFKPRLLSTLPVMALLGIALVYPNGAIASEAIFPRISLLLSSANDAPSPADVVAHDYSGGGAPPLAGLAVESPIGAAFLMLPRAEGGFASYLLEKPDFPRAKLERYVVVTYPVESDLDAALAALASDPFVAYAHLSTLAPQTDFPTTTAAQNPWSGAKAAIAQDWRSQVSLQAAWSLAGGWSLVGVLDQGFQTFHPDLVPFDIAGNLTGGNLFADYALDIGHAGFPGTMPDLDVDELQPEPLANWSPLCDPDQDGSMSAKFAGHGTHVAGLVSANAYDANAVAGACRNAACP